MVDSGLGLYVVRYCETLREVEQPVQPEPAGVSQPPTPTVTPNFNRAISAPFNLLSITH